MANWTSPSLTDLYTNFLAYIKARDDDAVRMNDSRVTAATNLPDYSKRWNDTTKTIQNWLSGVWSNLVMGIAGGGTGASTAADARSNLDVYSKAETAALAGAGHTTNIAIKSSNTLLTSAGVNIDVITRSLSAGTWLVIARIELSTDSPSRTDVFVKLYSGTSIYGFDTMTVGSNTNIDRRQATIAAIITLGATTPISLGVEPSLASTVYVIGSTNSVTNIIAVKIG